MTTPRRRTTQSSANPGEDAFPQALEAAKRESTLQLLFKVARLLDEEAVSRAARSRNLPKLRRSHMSLFPHIDLQGTRVTDLAERLGVSKQAVSQLVDDLESWGVLSRSADPEDARARLVKFTPMGKKGLLEGLALLLELEEELASRIGKKRMEELRGALLAIHDGWQRT